MYLLDENSDKPLHIQLYESIRSEIISRYTAGDKLPSIRKTAALYNLSKTTVETAYSQLYAEGYIESRPKSGYYVSDLDLKEFAPRYPHDVSQKRDEPHYRYDFFPARLRKEDFPFRLWKRHYNRTIESMPDMGVYHEGEGVLALKEAVARYLQHSRGTYCDAEHIIITSGFGDGMELLAKLLKAEHHIFGMEIPGYHVARKAFETLGYKVAPIPLDRHGVSLDALKRSDATLLYLTPSHQYPTGITMPIARRIEIVEYMRSINGYILEDDYDSELTYTTRPIPSLQGLDNGEHVIYLGTFAKSLSPALRVGYMVLPPAIMQRYRSAYDVYFLRVDLLTQLTLAAFIECGDYERHLRKLRTLNRKKHDLMKHAIKKHLGSTAKIVVEGGGLAILIQSDKKVFDYQKLQRLTEKAQIKIYLAKERSGGDFEAVRMGFGGFSLEEIEEAVEAFAKVWERNS